MKCINHSTTVVRQFIRGSSYGTMGHTNGRYSPFISVPTVYKTQGITSPKLIFDFWTRKCLKSVPIWHGMLAERFEDTRGINRSRKSIKNIIIECPKENRQTKFYKTFKRK